MTDAQISDTPALPARQPALDPFDASALADRLWGAARDRDPHSQEVRAELLAILRETLDAAHAAARHRVETERNAGLLAAGDIARAMDTVIAALHSFITEGVFRSTNPTDAERLAIVATGGYGRATLAPHSDVDILFLFPYKQTSWGESVVEYMLYMLWDLRLKVGQAVRSVDECVRLAASDITIRTAVLEARHLCGDPDLTLTLREKLWSDLYSRTGPEFVDAKLAERDARHRQMGDTRYVVEPNIKDGKGGLRDLQTLFWIGKYLYNVERPQDLVKHGVFMADEYRTLARAHRYLWTIRCHLHFLTGRAEERLTFDVQLEMARKLGYQDHGGTRAVERFMKHYFLAAKDVGDLTRIFCAALEDQQKKKQPRLGRLIPQLFRRAGAKAVHGFTVQNGRLTAESEDVFEADPTNLIRVFHIAQDAGVDIHPQVLKLIKRSLKLVNADLRENDPEANRLFLEILTSLKDPETTLRLMNEAGVLGRFVTDFGRIVCLMQFNMYHHYTADEHLIRAIGILSRVEKQELVKDHPVASRIIPNIVSRSVLYMSVLLHDIAKGRPEDHSTVGARIARRLCPRLGMSAAETESVAWLVQNHLVMSDFAQKRDIADPKTVRDFAEIVQSPERLRLLLVLTVVDIRAVGPGVWNGWKGELLRQLYYETESILQGGHSGVSRRGRVQYAKDQLAERLAGWPAADRDAFINRHYDPYWLILDTETHARHAALAREIGTGETAFGFAAAPDGFRDVTQVTVMMPDHPGIFSRVAGAFNIAGASVVDAKIFTTTDGMALDTFWVQDADGTEIGESARINRIEQAVRRALAGEVLVPAVLEERAAKRRKRDQAFTVVPRVLIDNKASDTYTVVEVNGRDRLGLLYDLTRALGRLHLSIASAHIATYGEQAVDVFYVKDMFGLKVTSPAKLKAIENELLGIIPDGGRGRKKAA